MLPVEPRIATRFFATQRGFRRASAQDIPVTNPYPAAAVTFFRPEEERLSKAFLEHGYVIAPAEDRAALDRIRNFVVDRAAAFLDLAPPDDPAAFLERIGDHVSDPDRLNALRLAIIDALTGAPWFREVYFACGRSVLETVVGNELAMQRGIGFSIQVPNDRSSVLPLHSDAWSEDSPFEVVLWIALVDVAATQSMFILTRERDAVWRERMREFRGRSVEELFGALEGDVEYLTIPYGNVLCFTHTSMHGNRMNVEHAARWSLNVRFKGLFTPYSDKKLGDFFDPVTLRPASRIGIDYRLPAGFDE
jgi:sporadic carbohydrate cluster 2OG-Fe(II) oxygenase